MTKLDSFRRNCLKDTLTWQPQPNDGLLASMKKLKATKKLEKVLNNTKSILKIIGSMKGKLLRENIHKMDSGISWIGLLKNSP